MNAMDLGPKVLILTYRIKYGNKDNVREKVRGDEEIKIRYQLSLESFLVAVKIRK